jgi:hypothetical protein
VLEIKNKCKIRVKWKLMGLEDFPEEFTFTVINVRERHKLEGELEPTEVALIEIEF